MEKLTSHQLSHLSLTSLEQKKRSSPQALTISSGEPVAGVKRKRDDGTEQQELPHIPCTDEEIKVIVKKWVVDRVLRVIKPSREPTKEDKQSSHYFHYHQYVHHKTKDCRVLRRMFHKKFTDGILDLAQEQEVQRNPLP